MNVILKDRFQEKLRLALKLRGWTQSDLAQAAGCHQPEVSRYILGKNCPSLDVVERFANALGVRPESLVDSSSIESEVMQEA